ncbi:MAG: caspase family protein [Myxococcales bacterium]
MLRLHFAGAHALGLLFVLSSATGCMTFTPFRAELRPCYDALHRDGAPAASSESGGAPEVRVQTGHSGPVSRIAVTPDSRYAVVGELNPARVKLWDLENAREVLTYPFDEMALSGVHLSGDGKRVLVDMISRGMRVLDVQSGRQLASCTETIQAMSIRVAIDRFSPDGRFAISRDYEDWKSGGQGNVVVWRMPAGEEVGKWKASTQIVPQFSPQGDALLVSSGKNRIELLDLNTVTAQRSWEVPGLLTAATFSTDGSVVYATNDAGALLEYDRATGAARGEPVPLTDGAYVLTLAPVPGRRELVVGGFQGELGTFDLEARRWKKVFASSGKPAPALSSDGARLFVAAPGRFFVWRMSDGRLEASWTPDRLDRTEAAVMLPDGKRVALLRRNGAKQYVELYDLSARRALWRAPPVELASAAAIPLSATTDGRHLLANFVGAKGNRLVQYTHVINASTGAVLRTVSLVNSDGYKISQSPAVGLSGGRIALTTRTDVFGDTLHVVDAASGASLLQQQVEFTTGSIAASPDGKRVLFSGSQNTGAFGDIHKAGPGTWSFEVEQRTVRKESEGMPGALVPGPNGQLVAATSDYVSSGQSDVVGKIVRRIELRVGTGTPRVLGTQGFAWAAFSPDGRRILWVGDDGFVHVASDDGAERIRFASFGDGEWVSMTPEGFFDASMQGAQYLSVRAGGTSYAIEQFYDRLYRPDLVLAAYGGAAGNKDAPALPAESLVTMVNQGPPPTVRIVSPSPGEQKSREVEIEVELADAGGGIGKVEWRINGAVVGVAGERGIRKVGSGPKEVRREKKVLSLAPGENVIEVVAYNGENGAFSRPASLALALRDDISDPPALHILAIAINQYRDRTLKLSYAVPDAKALSTSLQTSGKSVFTGVHATVLADADATADRIGAAFRELAAKVKPNDVFVLFVAGHGITQDGRYHFLPVDFRYVNEDSIREKAVNQDHLQEWMSAVSAKKSLVLLDTCNSGSFVQAQAVTRGIQEKTAIDKLTRATGRATIAASSDTQVALEGHEGHGVFTYAVLDALVKADRDFGNRDGVLTTTELAAYINEHVPGITFKRWGYEQVPQVNLHGREFPIAVSGK